MRLLLSGTSRSKSESTPSTTELLSILCFSFLFSLPSVTKQQNRYKCLIKAPCTELWPLIIQAAARPAPARQAPASPQPSLQIHLSLSLVPPRSITRRERPVPHFAGNPAESNSFLSIHGLSEKRLVEAEQKSVASLETRASVWLGERGRGKDWGFSAFSRFVSLIGFTLSGDTCSAGGSEAGWRVPRDGSQVRNTRTLPSCLGPVAQDNIILAGNWN